MKRNSKSILSILLATLLMIPGILSAQEANWFNLDLKADGVFGISTEKAYQELLINKKSEPVILAVIDSGVDTTHEDLKSILWVNKLEIAGNNKDDDENGYIDDIHGWNFIGSAKGNVEYDTFELTRLISRDMSRYDGKDSTRIPREDIPAFKMYQKNLREFERLKKVAEINYYTFSGIKETTDSLVLLTGKVSPTIEDFKSLDPASKRQKQLNKLLIAQLGKEKTNFEDFYKKEVKGAFDHFKSQLYYHLNLAYDPRYLVGDNYADSYEKNYGSPDVLGTDANHGTHVAGIIGAKRDNNLGVRGVANKVFVMPIRTVPNGDERDKDVANSIIYAVDNGAKVINMSFGKAYSWDKEAVDKAVQYAMKNDVLMVHAAGNDNKNLDLATNFPNRNYKAGKTAEAWLEVGASDANDNKTLKANFSNYGKTTVDVFAPGVSINSSVPGSLYELNSGTSMAAPVVSGLAALIRSYYPALSAVQVKEIIMKSVVKVDHEVNIMVNGKKENIPFSDLSISGGIVNAYEALKLAETYIQ